MARGPTRERDVPMTARKRVYRQCVDCAGPVFGFRAIRCARCGFSERARISDSTTVARFWAKVDCSGGLDACWPWTARSRTPKGYGYFSAGGRMLPASRWVLEQTLGRELVAGEFACHRCDTPLCCNPDHLFLGSNADNMADASRKGRLSKKLSPADVLAIREAMAGGAFGTDLAIRYGVAHSTIYRVRNHQIARHGAIA